MALALAAGSGASAAIGSSTHRDPRTGTLAGVALWIEHGNQGTVTVFNASGRLVAHREVRWGDDHFRFVLALGRYKVELKGAWCPSKKTVRVRANQTTNVGLSEGCENTY
jgi:hypothetical protein